jgi:hypothetical protein
MVARPQKGSKKRCRAIRAPDGCPRFAPRRLDDETPRQGRFRAIEADGSGLVTDVTRLADGKALRRRSAMVTFEPALRMTLGKEPGRYPGSRRDAALAAWRDRPLERSYGGEHRAEPGPGFVGPPRRRNPTRREGFTLM